MKHINDMCYCFKLILVNYNLIQRVTKRNIIKISYVIPELFCNHISIWRVLYFITKNESMDKATRIWTFSNNETTTQLNLSTHLFFNLSQWLDANANQIYLLQLDMESGES